MIKLNNKNITYVALADSNNSVKGVKEIWYADSNNSVKLVYRRKDALIEGVDYEKYHWLDGDGSAYVQVQGFVRNENWEITTSIANIQPTTHWILLYGYGYDAETGYNKAWTAFCDKNATYIRLRRCDGTTYNDNALATVQSVNTIIDGHNSVTINGETFTMSGRQYGQIPEFRIFSQFRDNLSTTIEKCNFSEFVVKENDLQILDLVPCKLLKPVPKWLDANGIRRQAGECGMIDLVSGKFYGNVNSVGTFTVENYYERKEWLIGDGSAYIDTGHNTNEDLDLETKVGNIRDNTFLFWFRTIQGIGDESMIVRTAPSRFRYANNSIEFEDNLTSQPINVETFGTTIFINGIEHSITKYYPRPSILFRLFYAEVDAASQTTVDTGYTTNNVGCSYFRFLDSNRNYIQNLIPCTLTMDLPASMDANNIARTKGTSGMWDLVSDRFYGNVASSGTFKAVNLAEGVDYEVHQWLVANGDDLQSSSPQKVALFSFPSDVNLVGKTVQLTMGAPCRDIYVYRYVGDGLYLVLYVLNRNVGVNVNNQAILFSPLVSQEPMVLDFENNLVSYNGQQAQIAGDSFYIYFPSAAIEGKRKYGRIYCQGLFDFIPCRLLRSIPSKYDANGIARQAGECGMYDTVNDKFYGNVASSGTFSVSDDE